MFGAAKKPDKPEKPTQSEAQRIRETESRRIYNRRFDDARAAGMPFEDAECFAHSDIDIGELRKLVKSGCAPELLGRILL